MINPTHYALIIVNSLTTDTLFFFYELGQSSLGNLLSYHHYPELARTLN